MNFARDIGGKAQILMQTKKTGMTTPLYDNHGRPITYVRLAVTDRCNLRCFYCMPAAGIPYVPRKELLTYEEMQRLLRILAEMGINKLRITGGEPFVRKGLLDFLYRVHDIPGIEHVHLTTNGVLTTPFVPALKEMGLASVNLSLDTLNPEKFKEITRRDEFDQVMACFEALMAHELPTKINAVVMDGKNDGDILSLAAFTEHHPVEVRFIEEMPFNGSGQQRPRLVWDYRRILARLRSRFPDIYRIAAPAHATSQRYQVPGFQGTIGIIPAFTRTFCGSCNRVRITPKGALKTCLYDGGVLNLRQLMRSGANDEELAQAFGRAFRTRPRDGFEAEQRRASQLPPSESMSTIGG